MYPSGFNPEGPAIGYLISLCAEVTSADSNCSCSLLGQMSLIIQNYLCVLLREPKQNFVS
jgi:hypothetical protein